jgi:hypothetical protein
MCGKKFLEFLFGADPLVMFGLTFDVFHRGRPLRNSDGERSVSLLPRKALQLWKIFMKPFRRPRFKQLDGLGHRNSARQGKQQVDVVSGAANGQCKNSVLRAMPPI